MIVSADSVAYINIEGAPPVMSHHMQAGVIDHYGVGANVSDPANSLASISLSGLGITTPFNLFRD